MGPDMAPRGSLFQKTRVPVLRATVGTSSTFERNYKYILSGYTMLQTVEILGAFYVDPT